eukprot:maker-scaffold_18-snap-gene-5.3-mRNA-1 protein AED:0.01 eAED:0.01 QI:424/1/1/1/1/1/4/221/469
MSRFVRSSKVRHVYGESAKQDAAFTDLKHAPTTGEQLHIKSDGQYIAFCVSRGTLTLLPLDSPGKVSPNLPLLDGHKGKTIDFEFSPHINSTLSLDKINFDNRECLLSSGGEDGCVLLWKLDTLPRENVSQPFLRLGEHGKKVTNIKWSQNVDRLVLSGSADQKVKVWDAAEGKNVYSFDIEAKIQDICFNDTTSFILASSQDKLVTLLDPRAEEIVHQWTAHDGNKGAKVLFAGDNKIITCGFARNASRGFKIFDLRNISGPKNGQLAEVKMDRSSGGLMPFHDGDLNMLYIGGKGDANVRYFEITDEKPFQYKLDEFRHNKPTKGMCALPKHALDIEKNEVARFLRLTVDSIEPLRFYKPTKSEVFQEEMFPPCYAPVPAASLKAWKEGKDLEPKRMSLDPKERGKIVKLSLNLNTGLKSPRRNGSLTPRASEQRLKLAKEYIATLRDKMESLGLGKEIPEMPSELK